MKMSMLGIEEISKIPVTSTYAWDGVFCGGDTISEKYETLFDMITTLCVRKIQESIDLAVVITPRMIGGSLSVSKKSFANADKKPQVEYIPAYEKTISGMYIGEFKKNCGNNGYHTGFHLFEKYDLPKDEILICVKGEINKIKLFNNFMGDE